MKFFLRLLILSGLLAVVLLCGVYFSLRQNITWQRYLLNVINQQSDFALKASEVDLDLFGTLTLSDVDVSTKETSLAKIDELDIAFEPLQLFSEASFRRLKFKGLELMLPQADSASGTETKHSLAIEGESQIRFVYDSFALSGEGEILLRQAQAAPLLTNAELLEDSKFAFDVQSSPKRVAIETFSARLGGEEDGFANFNLSGEFLLDNSITATVGAQNVDVPKMLSLFEVDEDQKRLSGVEEDKTHVDSEQKRETICNHIAAYDNVDIQLLFENVLHPPIHIEQFSSQLTGTPEALTLVTEKASINEIPLQLHALLQRDSCRLSGDAKVKNFPLVTALQIFDADVKDVDHGTVDSCELHAEIQLEDVTQFPAGTLTLSARKIWLPSKLQDFFPFNIIFLPFKVLLGALEQIGVQLLPGKAGELIAALSESMSESGRLELQALTIDIASQENFVLLKEVVVNPNLLPTLEFDGKIFHDGRLDMVVSIKLFGLRLRLPIAGTTDVPLPNVTMLVPELIKGLGLSLIP